MSNEQYEGGEADERMGTEETKPTRFRPRYRKLGAGELERIDEIKAAAEKLDRLVAAAYAVKSNAIQEEGKPYSREHALGITALEESVMWSVKGLCG